MRREIWVDMRELAKDEQIGNVHGEAGDVYVEFPAKVGGRALLSADQWRKVAFDEPEAQGDVDEGPDPQQEF